jgi:hypothetical protein
MFEGVKITSDSDGYFWIYYINQSIRLVRCKYYTNLRIRGENANSGIYLSRW